MFVGLNQTIRGGLALGLILQCAVASGNIISSSDTFDLKPNPQPSFSISNQFGSPPSSSSSTTSPQTASDNTVSLQQFNASLGTLNSVTIELTSTFTNDVTIDSAINDGETPTDFSAVGTLTLLLKGTGLIADQSPATSPQLTTTCSQLSDGGSCTNQVATSSGPFNATTSGLSFAPFIGSSTFDLTASLSSALMPQINPDNKSGFADNATMSASMFSEWAGTVKVTYDFTPVAGTAPEPLTLYLLAGGLGAIALIRRRRR